MVVEIWSDVMCPFCYIGKRKFEAALADYKDRDAVAVIWKSFQLDPDLVTDPQQSVPQSLAAKKGWSPQQTAQMIDHVTGMAQSVGLTYHFDKAVVANSFDAHRFSHYAKSKGKQDEAEERIFAAYFTAGQNTADLEVLAKIAVEIGMDEAETLAVLRSTDYTTDVLQDMKEAREFGINGVPFFVFNRERAISGAQDSSAFLEVLNMYAQK